MPDLMLAVIEDIWQLPRHIVSDAYDEALRRLAQYLPLTVHEVPSGTQCWTWRVPNKWDCREAWIEAEGQRLVDFAEHPLHIVYGSLPFDGIVSREELLRHLHWSEARPHAIPFEYAYYERDWGFCIPKDWLPRFTASQYFVHIDVDERPGTLKIGEFVVPGQTTRGFVLVAHLCHPAMVNDDVTGVAVNAAVARQWADTKPFYTYRFLFLPETIGSVAYLSQHEELIPELVGGIFLEMLGSSGPLVLQHSFEQNTRLDQLASYVLQQHQSELKEGAFRTFIGNDEIVFDGPGVRIPMISLSRWPYPEYHTSDDNPAILVPENLVHARDTVLDLLQHIEADYVPVRQFRGPLFLSGYGLWVDWRVNLSLNRALEWIMNRLEGTYSVSELAAASSVNFWTLRDWLERAYVQGLISKKPAF